MKISLANQEKILKQAARILEHRATYNPEFMESPEAVKKMFACRLQMEKQEVFSVAFLDNRHRVIAVEDMFYGTINSAAVYPREVVRAAMKHNCAAVILSHNHPSGMAEPSRSDVEITKKLKQALSLIDVRILDHIIIGSGITTSLAERGEM
jgi:DNA repair protein RadC